MAKPKAKPFAVLCFCFRKPRPWRRHAVDPQDKIRKEGVSIKKIANYLKCTNASSMLLKPYRERHPVSKWSAKRPFPFLKRNMEVCVNAWGAYENRFKNFMRGCNPSTQKQLTNYPMPQVDEESSEEDADSFLAAIDRVPLSPSPPPLSHRPSTSKASVSAQRAQKRVDSAAQRCQRIFQAVFRGGPQEMRQPDHSNKRNSSRSRATEVNSDDVILDYVVEEPPESITSSADCEEREEQQARVSAVRKQSLTSMDEYAHDRTPLSSVTKTFVNSSYASSANMKTPKFQTPKIQHRNVQRLARSVKRSDLVNYSDSEEDNDDDYENEMTPIPLNRYRARRIIQSPTTEERNRPAKKKKAKHPSPSPQRRSPRIQSKKQKSTAPKVKVEPEVHTPISRLSSNKRRSSKMETSLLSEVPPARRRPTLAIEAPPSPPRKKRWSKTEMDRLKVAIRAVGDPHSLQDWEKIAMSISGGERSADECREQAVKLQLWKPGGGGDADGGGAKARKPSNSKADYFANKTYGDMTLLDLDPDDSLLSILKTPTEPVKYSRKPALLQQVINETQYSARSSFNDSI